MDPYNRLVQFDPQKLAYFEKENYVAYYQKAWPRLFRVSVAMVREAFGFSLWRGVYGAYLVGRAEMAAAPVPKNDIPRAEAYMERFFGMTKTHYQLKFDEAEAARREVNWWVVHRRLFAQEENRELVYALAEAAAYIFDVPKEVVMEASAERARGILYSDQWVRVGLDLASPLLKKEEQALCSGYQLLRNAVLSSRRAKEAA